MNQENSESIGNQRTGQKKGRFMFVDGQWYLVPNDFELVYKRVSINGKKFPFGFKRRKPEKCELN